MRMVTGEQFRNGILHQVVNWRKTDLDSIIPDVKRIVREVRRNGDEAVLRYTQKFDQVCITAANLKATDKEIKVAYNKLEGSQIQALRKATKNIHRFHKKQRNETWSQQIEEGVTVGQVTTPLSSVGVYAPGGTAPYPSSLLMCAIPAAVAGVTNTVVCSPPRKNGTIHPALLVAADLSQVTEVYRIGGAQAIAAMAYGTHTVPQVDKIVGPGNSWVTAAKLEVSRDVAIDIPAGPSEILIIADETGDPSFIASDLLAQAEHDRQALAILLTPSQELGSAVKDEVDKQVRTLCRTETVKSSMQTRGFIVIVENIQQAVKYANSIAPEHLHIQTQSPGKIFEKIQNAGAVFLGKYSPVAFGDYSSGLNHVLPTNGYATTCSGLSTTDFLKRINFLQCTRKGYQQLKSTTLTLAEMEGLDGHAKSVLIRDEENEN